MSIEVFAADEQTDAAVDSMRWVRLAEEVLGAEGVRGDAELSVLFVDENAMTDLNKRFLGKDQRSGLVVIGDILSGVEGIGFVRFGGEDVVRHKLVQRIVEAYGEYAARERHS